MDFKEFQVKYQKKAPEHKKNSVSENPLVSVCVQTYNHKPYLKMCLDSILAQEADFDYEILLGEDQSLDGTREICLEYARNHPKKIRLFLHHSENKIQINSVTTGNFNAFYNFYNARGKYIAFCEGDDYWDDPLKLQKQVDFLNKNKEFVLCFHRYHFVDESKLKLDDSNFPEKPLSDITSIDLKEMNVHPLFSTVCFRKEFNSLPVQALNVINVDTFILSMLGSFGAGKYIKGINPSYYRIHNDGVWSKKTKASKFINKIITFRQLKEYYQRIGDPVTSKSFSEKAKLYIKMALFNYIKTGNLKGIFKIKKIFTYIRKQS